MAVIWERLEIEAITDIVSLQRAKVPGGWLVITVLLTGGGVAFYPDPQHLWDGNSLPHSIPAQDSGTGGGSPTSAGGATGRE